MIPLPVTVAECRIVLAIPEGRQPIEVDPASQRIADVPLGDVTTGEELSDVPDAEPYHPLDIFLSQSCTASIGFRHLHAQRLPTHSEHRPGHHDPLAMQVCRLLPHEFIGTDVPSCALRSGHLVKVPVERGAP